MEKVIDALKEVGYQGDVTLESICFFRPLPKELLPAALKYAATVAEYFREKVSEK
jgi:hypothetical protein